MRLPRALRVALPFIAAGLCGCGASAAPRPLDRFPIGIYQVDEPRHIVRLKKDGFDTILPYTNDPATLAKLAKEARRQGMRMIAPVDGVREADAALTKDWPIDAWYIKDEPDRAKMSSTTLQDISDKTRAWDDSRPQAFVLGQGSAAKLYGHIANIVMLDWYPIPHMPADTVADQADLVTRAIPAGKPFWMVVQAYDWADEVTDPVKRKGLRFPTHGEIRFMSYISILHGAKGLFYFCLTKKGQTLFEYPELWQAVSRVSREMKAMKPIFERGKRINLPFPPDPFGPEAAAWRYRGRDYVVILNRKAKVFQKVPSELVDMAWRPLNEVRRDPREVLKEMNGAYYLRPYQVLVLESRLRLFK